MQSPPYVKAKVQGRRKRYPRHEQQAPSRELEGYGRFAVHKGRSLMKRTRHGAKSHQRFLLREAAVHDVDVLVRHRRGMWEDLGVRNKSVLDEADRAYRRWVKSGFKNERLLGWIAETKEGVVAGSGCIWLRSAQPRPSLKVQIQPYLLSLYTEPLFRRRGVASSIVREAIKWCRRNGYSRLALHASRYGRSLYQKYGFTRSWEMRLKLDGKARHRC